MEFEVIVIDHDSQDKTLNVALNNGAKVISQKGGTVASLRNKGAGLANNDILIFLDADVLLTPEWRDRFTADLCSKIKNDRLITGSWVEIGSNPSWIEKHWFKPLQHGGNTHINSGHFIVSKKIFNELEGFDEKLETGEDYELSQRAKKNNVLLCDDPLLKVIHEGFPKTLKAFFLRELWHGKGDMLNIHNFIRSKVAIVSIIILFLHVGLLINYYGFYFLLSICCVSFCSALVKYRKTSIGTIFINSLLYYVYYLARGLSVFSIFRLSRDNHIRIIE